VTEGMQPPALPSLTVMSTGARHMAGRSHRTWLQRLAISSGVVLTTFCIAAASLVGYVYWATGRFGRANLQLDSAGRNEPRNYLIIGSDSRDTVDANDPTAGAFLGPGEPAGKRSDTILLVRIDPIAGTVKMLSFPRDLWLPIADSGKNDRINAAYGRGRQVLVDTIRNDFGVVVNNYIEVDFRGFKDLVNAIGGVPMYFDTAMRDGNTGLDIQQPGCVVLDGDQALAFARSRHLQFKDGRGRWQEDQTQDLGRITRQQIFVRTALHKALSMGLITNPKTFFDLLSVATNSVTLDQTIDRSDLNDLRVRFQNLDPNTIETYSLPATDHMTDGGAAVLLLQEDEAQPILDVFRGKDPGSLAERAVSVNVLNGTGVPGQARDVGQALTAVGFAVGPASNAAAGPTTIIKYAPGSEQAADLLARHLTAAATQTADPSLESNHLTLVTGTDFTTVMQTPRSPNPTTAPLPIAGSLPTTAPAPTTTSTTLVGITPGQPPPGVTC
jgi:LCP family protein required for cell wall assembly